MQQHKPDPVETVAERRKVKSRPKKYSGKGFRLSPKFTRMSAVPALH